MKTNNITRSKFSFGQPFPIELATSAEILNGIQTYEDYAIKLVGFLSIFYRFSIFASQ